VIEALTLLRASPGMTKAKEFLKQYAAKARDELALCPTSPAGGAAGVDRLHGQQARLALFVSGHGTQTVILGVEVSIVGFSNRLKPSVLEYSEETRMTWHPYANRLRHSCCWSVCPR